MKFYVEQSPMGGYWVRMEGAPAPISRHDTEEEAFERAAAYARASAVAATDEVELRDGSRVLVRPIRADDKGMLADAFGRLSRQSRYQRFLGFKKELGLDELEYLTEVDHHDHEGLFGIDPASGEVVAVARFVRLRSRPEAAEAAIVIADEWQGRGLGTAVLRRLAERAREEGIHTFTATLLADNRSMVDVFGRVGEVRVTGREGGVEEIDVELPAEPEPLQEALRAVAIDPPADPR
jgi:RimJ/RimL family protein N-acetyltransferase